MSVSPSATAPGAQPADPALTQTLTEFAGTWYQALDRHDPLAAVTPYLADEGLVMNFPEGRSRGIAGFAQWYEAVTHRFFDEEHTVLKVEVQQVREDTADVLVVVNWQTKVWNPPAAASVWMGFDAYQSWTVQLGEAGPRILTYTVDALTPMPGSPDL
ncbi:nuclear transport factor 2 family protein [Streptomyces sp. CA-111067]|uniref:nuclear transport factor 2 family protein n=1 Tax=Streptomyces sp. CA-111067 TaxID=3240046 RepID=UPI003D95A35E